MRPIGGGWRTLAAVVGPLLLVACGGDGADPSGTATTTASSPASTALPTTSTPPAPTAAASTSPPDSLLVTEVTDDLADWRPWVDRHVDVFGVHVLALPGVSDGAITHAASVLAQYLDNDADGRPDDTAVLAAMLDAGATLLMAFDEDDLERSGIFGSGLDRHHAVQDLYDVETGAHRRFDASLEEVHHLVFDTGWSQVYPERLGVEERSDLTRAMDAARGGRFEEVPDAYPPGAWYHYDDETCDYGCMATEYAYWAHTSLLGAQADPGRCEEIAIEWRPCTPKRMRSTDSLATDLFGDPELGLPTVLPDGHYGPDA